MKAAVAILNGSMVSFHAKCHFSAGGHGRDWLRGILHRLIIGDDLHDSLFVQRNHDRSCGRGNHRARGSATGVSDGGTDVCWRGRAKAATTNRLMPLPRNCERAKPLGW